MSDGTQSARFALTTRRYRWLDRITKLIGVALIAGGLEAGGGTPAGIALAAFGVTIGLSTVIIDKQ
jgi:hypothetical protein